MTGVNIHIITPIVCIVCVFYTCVVSFVLNLPKFEFFFLFIEIFKKGWIESRCLDRCRANIFNVWRSYSRCRQRNNGFRWRRYCV